MAAALAEVAAGAAEGAEGAEGAGGSGFSPDTIANAKSAGVVVAKIISAVEPY